MIDKIISTLLFPAVWVQAMLPPAAANLISPDCLFSMLFDISCFGCGMGRAMHALLHFEWQHAISLNKLSPIVLLVLATLFICGIRNSAKKFIKNLAAK